VLWLPKKLLSYYPSNHITEKGMTPEAYNELKLCIKSIILPTFECSGPGNMESKMIYHQWFELSYKMARRCFPDFCSLGLVLRRRITKHPPGGRIPSCPWGAMGGKREAAEDGLGAARELLGTGECYGGGLRREKRFLVYDLGDKKFVPPPRFTVHQKWQISDSHNSSQKAV